MWGAIPSLPNHEIALATQTRALYGPSIWMVVARHFLQRLTPRKAAR